MGGLSSWAVNIVHTNGNKLPIYKPKRAHVVSLPEMAEAAENEGAKKMCEERGQGGLAGTRHSSYAARDTASIRQPQRSVFGSKASGLLSTVR